MGEISEGMTLFEEGENQPQIGQKRIKFQEGGISGLPECLLIEILSRLPLTKDAIRTCALSKRWAHLWTLVPCLVFSFTDIPRSQSNSRSNYTLLVDKTLTQCRQLKLKKFELHTFYDIRFESQINNWISYAISCNVEELNLAFWYNNRREAEFQFRLDQSLFFSSCFTHLRLVGCMLNPTEAICWKNLRSLRISYLNLDEDLIVNILSGSPLLETLELEYCYGYPWADNYNTCLDDESESESEAEIEVNALSLTQCPQLNLKTFKVLTRFLIEFESQLNSWIRYAIRCNVKELNLRFWNSGFGDEFMMLDQILFTSSSITELTLYGCIVNPVGAISWNNLRSLCISDSLYGCIDEDLIENILSGSPVLETLMLDNCYGYRRLNITSKSVKNLVFSEYWNPYDSSESEVEYIIEINAPNILSLTIQRNIFLQKLLLLNVSSLVKADLNYTCTNEMHLGTTNKMHRGTEEAEEEMLKGHIMNLGHVKEIKIGFLCSKAVSCLQAKGFVFPSNVNFHGVRFENR